MSSRQPISAGVASWPADIRLSRRISIGDYDILYFGNDWSAENRTSSHHVARRLAERTRVLYVDTPGLRAPKATARDAGKLWRKVTAALRRPRPVADGLWHLSVPQIPFRRFPLVQRANVAIGEFLIGRALKRLGLERTVSWFAVPHPALLANRFGEVAVVYHCIDDYAALPGVDTTAIAALDEHLTRQADQVFVASTRMLRSKQQVTSAVSLAPHGVDVTLFRSASDPDLPLAPGARHLPRPVIGFYGLIEKWIDLDLIADLAERRPEWTFLMIGRLAVDAGRLKQMRNVTFVGPQPYESLPAWAAAFDVALIPYRLNRQVMNAAPLKLREYLATGKPIVSVRTPAIEQFAGLVRIADGPDQFVARIEHALSNDSAADRVRRMEATSGLTWEARVNQLVDVVEQMIRKKELHP